MRPSVVALACSVLAAGVSIAACAEESVVEPGATGPIATELIAPGSTSMVTSASTSDAPAASPSTQASASTPGSASPELVDAWRPVVSFADASSIDGWSNVDDTVMGGVSASTTSWASGRLVFAGDLSLENNGGFASVRGPIDPALGAALDEATALAVDAEGDGRTYVLQLRTAEESLYITRFTTTDGEAEQYVLPLAEFEPVTRFLEPSPSTPPLDAGTIVQLAVYVLDAQEGSFRLAIGNIAAQ